MGKEEIIENKEPWSEKNRNFGSVVREGAREDGDIDVVVEFEKGKAAFKNVAGLVDFLESISGREIDLLTPDGIESIRIKHVKEKNKGGAGICLSVVIENFILDTHLVC